MLHLGLATRKVLIVGRVLALLLRVELLGGFFFFFHIGNVVYVFSFMNER
jgi:hypothetical protein